MLTAKPIVIAFASVIILIAGTTVWVAQMADSNEPKAATTYTVATNTAVEKATASASAHNTTVDHSGFPAPAKKLTQLLKTSTASKSADTDALIAQQQQLKDALAAIDTRLSQSNTATNSTPQMDKTLAQTQARLDAIKQHMANK